MDFPWWLRRKASVCNVGYPGLIPGSGRCPGGGKGNPLQYTCLKNSVGYSPWGSKALGTTERLHFHLYLYPSLLSCAPCVTEQFPARCLFYTQWYIYMLFITLLLQL